MTFRKPLRLAWPIIALCGACLLAAGCGRRGDVASSGGESTDHPLRIVRVGNGDEPQDLDPHAITGEPEYRILMALFEGLATMDPHDLHPVPGLAESWEISPD